MSCCATHGQGSPSALAPRNRARKLPCVDSRSLVETSREVRAPVRRPLRRQAYPSVAIGAREVKEVVVLPEPQLVFWFSANGGQPRARFPVGRVQTQRVLKFAASLASFACGSQRPRTGGVKVSAFRIEVQGPTQRSQRLIGSSFAGIHARKPHPVVRIVPRGSQNFDVFLFRFRYVPGPRQNACAPSPHVHVLGRSRNLTVNDSHCRIPILLLRVFAHRSLPIGCLLLAESWACY